MFAMDTPKRIRNLAYGRIRSNSGKNIRHQVVGSSRRIFQAPEGGFRLARVATGARMKKVLDLRSLDCRISRVEGNLLFLIRSKLIYSNDDAFFCFNGLL